MLAVKRELADTRKALAEETAKKEQAVEKAAKEVGPNRDTDKRAWPMAKGRRPKADGRWLKSSIPEGCDLSHFTTLRLFWPFFQTDLFLALLAAVCGIVGTNGYEMTRLWDTLFEAI